MRESVNVPVRRMGDVGARSDSDRVAVEEPLEIRLSCVVKGAREVRSLAITMRTPGDDVNLVAGFLFSEGIVTHGDDISAISEVAENIIQVDLAPEKTFDLERLQRHFYATSSCGVCGKASLEALRVQSAYHLDENHECFSADVLSRLPESLSDGQAVFSETGGLHAAAAFNAHDGKLLDVHEDVGRHNAVDKLVGAALRENRIPLSGQGILVSGRAGFEIVQKVLMAGCPLLAAVGAPSSLAVELAWEFNMTLVGFLRDGRFNIYSGPARIS
jgi:FdhD protein